MRGTEGIASRAGFRHRGRQSRSVMVVSAVLLGLWSGSAGSLRGSSLLRGTPQMGDSPMGAVKHGVNQSPQDAADATRQDAAVARMQEQQAKSRNDDRQKRLVDDTAKLYALAGELKDEVAKTDKNKLSVDVVKKADEIERLARSVKEKMKG